MSLLLPLCYSVFSFNLSRPWRKHMLNLLLCCNKSMNGPRILLDKHNTSVQNLGWLRQLGKLWLGVKSDVNTVKPWFTATDCDPNDQLVLDNEYWICAYLLLLFNSETILYSSHLCTKELLFELPFLFSSAHRHWLICLPQTYIIVTNLLFCISSMV